MKLIQLRILIARNIMKKIYLTTPIFYVNDSPHIGHAYTMLICDTLAKFFQLDGYEVLFTTGTDEHGMKVEKAANKKQIEPKVFVDKVSKNFVKLSKTLKISNTDFVRTTEERHKKAAKAFWEVLTENNQIYLSDYKGWYSVRDESFFLEKELEKRNNEFYTVDGEKVQWIEEESFFFKLSNWEDELLKYYDNNPEFISPSTRRNEVISFVKSGLKDLSISRTSFGWGIKVEKTSNHIMYVWIDALVNYLTSLNYPEMSEKSFLFWENSSHVYCDNFHTWISHKDDVVIQRKNIMFEHLHPSIGKSEADQFYVNASTQEEYDYGSKVFHNLIKENFNKFEEKKLFKKYLNESDPQKKYILAYILITAGVDQAKLINNSQISAKI